MSTIKVTNIQDTSGGNQSTSEEIFEGRAKAWVNFDGSAGAVSIRGSFNVSSITENATGDYTVTFATNMPDTNYVPLLTPIARDNASGGTTQPGVRSTGGASAPNASLTVSGVRFVHRPTSTNVDADMLGLVVFGD
tara:strand:+ start:448 stop:855 length:408 start_codon:yes stop_codon:yes gene_type:complete